VHLPGIFTRRVIALTAEQAGDKQIQKTDCAAISN